jgi:hypothetical protein
VVAERDVALGRERLGAVPERVGWGVAGGGGRDLEELLVGVGAVAHRDQVVGAVGRHGGPLELGLVPDRLGGGHGRLEPEGVVLGVDHLGAEGREGARVEEVVDGKGQFRHGEERCNDVHAGKWGGVR